MKIKHIVYLVLIIGICSLVGYRIMVNSEVGKPVGNLDQPQETTVSGMVVKPQVFKDIISLSGTLEANEQIELHSEVSGGS